MVPGGRGDGEGTVTTKRCPVCGRVAVYIVDVDDLTVRLQWAVPVLSIQVDGIRPIAIRLRCGDHAPLLTCTDTGWLRWRARRYWQPLGADESGGEVE